MINGRRQPSRGGTSRMNGEVQVRFCERLGVQFPGPTRQNENPPHSGLCQLSPATDVPLHEATCERCQCRPLLVFVLKVRLPLSRLGQAEYREATPIAPIACVACFRRGLTESFFVQHSELSKLAEA